MLRFAYGEGLGLTIFIACYVSLAGKAWEGSRPYFYCVLRCACGEAWERGLILLRVTLRVRGRPGKVNEARARSRRPNYLYTSRLIGAGEE